jgi:hypothetical protein
MVLVVVVELEIQNAVFLILELDNTTVHQDFCYAFKSLHNTFLTGIDRDAHQGF